MQIRYGRAVQHTFTEPEIEQLLLPPESAESTMSKHNMYSTANLSDTELKEQGNRLFSCRKFDDAIQCYTKAIVSQLFTI